MLYPKIYNLFQREDNSLEKSNKRRVIESKFYFPEFGNIIAYHVDEKIDGTNVRIEYNDGKVFIGGRTENTQMHPALFKYLNETFYEYIFGKVFNEPKKPYPKVVLFGEGIGPKIQGGSYERDYYSFILFDVNINGHWLNREDVEGVAKNFFISCVPDLGCMDIPEIVDMVKSKPKSFINADITMEGIIARTQPQLYTKNGSRVMFKLRCIDFD